MFMMDFWWTTQRDKQMQRCYSARMYNIDFSLRHWSNKENSLLSRLHTCVYVNLVFSEWRILGKYNMLIKDILSMQTHESEHNM